MPESVGDYPVHCKFDVGILEARRLVASFETALDDGREEFIHQFIASNTQVLGFVGPGVDSWMWSKFRLGHRFVPDFLCVGDEGGNDVRAHVTMIEIERANASLFTAKGDPSAFLTHATRQVQDWRRWVTENRDYLARDLQTRLGDHLEKGGTDCDTIAPVQRALIHHFRVVYFVVAGRRRRMRVADRLRLAQMNDDLTNIEIITYDGILDRIMRCAERTTY